MIALVDYGAGNVGSVAKAVRHLGGEAEIVHRAEDLRKAEKIILPGQGHFESMVGALHEGGLFAPLKELIAGGRRYLGICLGLQVLYERSEEAPSSPGFALLPGEIRRLAGVFKIPHIGWSQLEVRKAEGLLSDVPDGSFFYFCHSYSAPDGPYSVGATQYGRPFASVVEKGSFCGVQFHPEKSGDLGLKVLRNFLES